MGYAENDEVVIFSASELLFHILSISFLSFPITLLDLRLQ